MTSAAETRRHVMLMAWSSRRAEPSRSFADCLRAAWAFAKRSLATAARLMARARTSGGRLTLRDLIQPASAGAAMAAGKATKAAMLGFYR